MGAKQSDIGEAPAWFAGEIARLTQDRTVATGPDGIVLIGSRTGVGVNGTTWRDARELYAAIDAPDEERRRYADAFFAQLRKHAEVDLPAAKFHPQAGKARRVGDRWVCVDASGGETPLCSVGTAFVLALSNIGFSARMYSVNQASGEWLHSSVPSMRHRMRIRSSTTTQRFWSSVSRVPSGMSCWWRDDGAAMQSLGCGSGGHQMAQRYRFCSSGTITSTGTTCRGGTGVTHLCMS